MLGPELKCTLTPRTLLERLVLAKRAGALLEGTPRTSLLQDQGWDVTTTTEATILLIQTF